ncbi:MAG: hypothetical protein U0Y68_03305 [Blastocatellia bacterium]
MATQPKRNRTQLKDLAVNEQDLTAEEMTEVQGGTSNLNLSKSNINVAPPPSTTTTNATSHDATMNAIRNTK